MLTQTPTYNIYIFFGTNRQGGTTIDDFHTSMSPGSQAGEISMTKPGTNFF